MDSIIKNIIDAHGGLRAWLTYDSITADLTFGGAAFALRFNRTGVRTRRVTVFTKTQKVIFYNFPHWGFKGYFTPEKVWIESNTYLIDDERISPRNYFNRFRRSLWWDDLDLLYFAGYASWNYLNTPFLFSLPGMKVNEIENWNENNEIWKKLEVEFPPIISTHSAIQHFYVDRNHHIRRHDYNPEVFHEYAYAAHYSYLEKYFDGFLFPTKRMVYPRLTNNRSVAWPLLVWIHIDNITLNRNM